MQVLPTQQPDQTLAWCLQKWDNIRRQWYHPRSNTCLGTVKTLMNPIPTS